MSRKETIAVAALLIAMSLFWLPSASLAQSNHGESTAQQSAPPSGSPSIVIPCNGGNTTLGMGGAVGIKLTFVLNYPTSGCWVKLQCIDLPTADFFVAAPGTGPAVFGCAAGRIQLIGGDGGGFARVYIGGAD